VAGPYRTVNAEARCEIAKIKGSRFIATAGPFRDEAALAGVIARLRDEFSDANHHCYAWRFGDRFRYNDDGEPSGTAGRPILQRIDGRDLDRTYVVVTRIFGGTKLGAGGLVRAYSAAAGAALDAAQVVEVVPTSRIRVIVPYELMGAVASVVAAHGVTPLDSVFAEVVTQTFAVPTNELDDLMTALQDRTAGRAGVERLD
jgi:uncharacterized YigZ family protein